MSEEDEKRPLWELMRRHHTAGLAQLVADAGGHGGLGRCLSGLHLRDPGGAPARRAGLLDRRGLAVRGPAPGVPRLRRHLRKADELQRAIQLHALALGFGASWLALCGYPLLERLGAPALVPGDYVVVMAVFFSLRILLGRRRYR